MAKFSKCPDDIIYHIVDSYSQTAEKQDFGSIIANSKHVECLRVFQKISKIINSDGFAEAECFGSFRNGIGELASQQGCAKFDKVLIYFSIFDGVCCLFMVANGKPWHLTVSRTGNLRASIHGEDLSDGFESMTQITEAWDGDMMCGYRIPISCQKISNTISRYIQ